jgi:hypothetical protein
MANTQEEATDKPCDEDMDLTRLHESSQIKSIILEAINDGLLPEYGVGLDLGSTHSAMTLLKNAVRLNPDDVTTESSVYIESVEYGAKEPIGVRGVLGDHRSREQTDMLDASTRYDPRCKIKNMKPVAMAIHTEGARAALRRYNDPWLLITALFDENKKRTVERPYVIVPRDLSRESAPLKTSRKPSEEEPVPDPRLVTSVEDLEQIKRDYHVVSLIKVHDLYLYNYMRIAAEEVDRMSGSGSVAFISVSIPAHTSDKMNVFKRDYYENAPQRIADSLQQPKLGRALKDNKVPRIFCHLETNATFFAYNVIGSGAVAVIDGGGVSVDGCAGVFDAEGFPTINRNTVSTVCSGKCFDKVFRDTIAEKAFGSADAVPAELEESLIETAVAAKNKLCNKLNNALKLNTQAEYERADMLEQVKNTVFEECRWAYGDKVAAVRFDYAHLQQSITEDVVQDTRRFVHELHHVTTKDGEVLSKSLPSKYILSGRHCLNIAFRELLKDEIRRFRRGTGNNNYSFYISKVVDRSVAEGVLYLGYMTANDLISVKENNDRSLRWNKEIADFAHGHYIPEKAHGSLEPFTPRSKAKKGQTTKPSGPSPHDAARQHSANDTGMALEQITPYQPEPEFGSQSYVLGEADILSDAAMEPAALDNTAAHEFQPMLSDTQQYSLLDTVLDAEPDAHQDILLQNGDYGALQHEPFGSEVLAEGTVLSLQTSHRDSQQHMFVSHKAAQPHVSREAASCDLQKKTGPDRSQSKLAKKLANKGRTPHTDPFYMVSVSIPTEDNPTGIEFIQMIPPGYMSGSRTWFSVTLNETDDPRIQSRIELNLYRSVSLGDRSAIGDETREEGVIAPVATVVLENDEETGLMPFKFAGQTWDSDEWQANVDFMKNALNWNRLADCKRCTARQIECDHRAGCCSACAEARVECKMPRRPQYRKLWSRTEGWTIQGAEQAVEESMVYTKEQRAEIVRLQCEISIVLEYINNSRFRVTVGNINSIAECEIDGTIRREVKATRAERRNDTVSFTGMWSFNDDPARIEALLGKRLMRHRDLPPLTGPQLFDYHDTTITSEPDIISANIHLFKSEMDRIGDAEIERQLHASIKANASNVMDVAQHEERIKTVRRLVEKRIREAKPNTTVSQKPPKRKRVSPEEASGEERANKKHKTHAAKDQPAAARTEPPYGSTPSGTPHRPGISIKSPRTQPQKATKSPPGAPQRPTVGGKAPLLPQHGAKTLLHERMRQQDTMQRHENTCGSGSSSEDEPPARKKVPPKRKAARKKTAVARKTHSNKGHDKKTSSDDLSSSSGEDNTANEHCTSGSESEDEDDRKIRIACETAREALAAVCERMDEPHGPWDQKLASDLYGAISNAVRNLEKTIRDTAKKMPVHLQSRCSKISGLAEALNRCKSTEALEQFRNELRHWAAKLTDDAPMSGSDSDSENSSDEELYQNTRSAGGKKTAQPGMLDAPASAGQFVANLVKSMAQ